MELPDETDEVCFPLKLTFFSFFLIFIIIIFLIFIWLHQVLIAARGTFIAVCGIFSCDMRDLFFGFGMWDLFFSCGTQALSCGMQDLVP